MKRNHQVIGEFPATLPLEKGFNHSKWLASRPIEWSRNTPATAPGYRERKAKILLARINAGKLSPSARDGVERDYAKELAKLRKASR